MDEMVLYEIRKNALCTMMIAVKNRNPSNVGESIVQYNAGMQLAIESGVNKNCLDKMLPNSFVFKDVIDFNRVGQILSVIFKEIIWGWEPKNKEGNFVIGKDYLRISFKKIPKELKKRFNNRCFYLDGRRALIQ